MTTTTKTFPCGCEFEVIDGKIQFNTDVETLNLECPEVWALLGEGKTVGVFQLESRLGQTISAKLKPENIEQLSDLIAVIRPGCLDSYMDDQDGKSKNITSHYIDRKNNSDQVTYYHESLEEILSSTFALLIFQEQAMAIVQKLADFDLSQADVLRRAIGKKKVSDMQDAKKDFMEGCKKKKLVDDETAAHIFSWIESSQRYSFNKSHSVAYAMNAYLAVYAKVHFPHQFFTSSLYHTRNSPKPFERIQEIVSDLRYFDIDILPPSIHHLHKNFQLIDNTIYFGITNIKGIGDSVYNKLTKRINAVCKKLGKTIDQLTWMETLIFIFSHIPSTGVVAMINVGVFSHLKKDRKQLRYEYEKYSLLSKDKEQSWVQDNFAQYNWDSLSDCISTIVQSPIGKKGVCANKTRHARMKEMVQALASPSYNLKDSAAFIATEEESLLGCPITYSHVEACDKDEATCNCQDFIKDVGQQTCWIAAQIDRKHEITTKTNKLMCFLTCSDIHGTLDNIVVFPEVYEKSRALLFNRNTIMLVGNRGKDKGSLIVKKIYQI